MERVGLSREVLIYKYLRPLLSAKMVKGYVIEGELVEKTYVDNSIRLQAVKVAGKWSGLEIGEQENEGQQIRGIILDLSHRPPQKPMPALEPPDIVTPAP